MSDTEWSRQLTLAELAALVDGTVEGDPETSVGSVTGVDTARPDSLVRVDDRRYLEAAVSGPGVALLFGVDLEHPPKPAIRVRNPRLAFAVCLEALVEGEPRPPAGVHPSAVLGQGVELGEGVAILPGVVVGDGVRIGPRTVIHPNATLGRGVRVGADCEIFANVQIYARVEIGDRVRLHSGVVLGGDGFGYVWDGQQHRKILHVGSVRLGDDVEIGANCAIDRATTGVTEIGSGTKIDNLVQIGHNVRLGPHCLIVAQCGLAGSSSTGAGVVLGGQAALRDHVHVGDQAQVGGRGGVWADLAPQGIYSGNPARRHLEEERSIIAYQRGPELLRRLRAVERELEALKGQLASLAGDEER